MWKVFHTVTYRARIRGEPDDLPHLPRIAVFCGFSSGYPDAPEPGCPYFDALKPLVGELLTEAFVAAGVLPVRLAPELP
jgi:hypothetical protein